MEDSAAKRKLSDNIYLFIYFYFTCIDILPMCMSVYYICPAHEKVKEGIGGSGTRVTDRPKLPCLCCN